MGLIPTSFGGMDEQVALLSEIDAYIASRGITESTFGRMAVNDGKFVARIRRGGSTTLATVARVREFIQSNPPKAGTPTAPPAKVA